MKKRRLKNFILFLCMLLLTGCAKMPVMQEAEEPVREEFSQEEMLLLMAGRISEVSDVFGKGILQVRMNESGDTYQDTLFELTKDYVEKVDAMTQLALAKGIVISLNEKKEIAARAQKYLEDYQKSGETEVPETEAVEKVLTNLLLVEKIREKLIADAGVEVSESEAKVMDIIRIELDDSGKAYETLEEANANPENFASIARRNSVNSETEIKVGRGDLGSVIDEEIFRLEDGEISPVMQYKDKYYIIQVVKGYDPEATALRKEAVRQNLENEVIGKAYKDYIAENPYEIDAEIWKEVTRRYSGNTGIPDIHAYAKSSGGI